MGDGIKMRLSGGDKLETALRELAKKVGSGGTVQVGFPADATYKDGTSVATVAAIQEFGAPSRNIPPRPFFRGMIAEHSPEWAEQLGGILQASEFDTKQSLKRMGGLVAAQLRDSIQQFTDPALAPATVVAKGSDKPLVDTGHMLQSVASVVKDE